MNYDEALEYIHGTWKFGSKLGLENIRDLLRRMGNPQEQFKSIHVAGTNGKGSVTSMMAHILHEAGYRVGMFVSPYLENFTERIQVNFQEIVPEELATITATIKEKVEDMVSQGKNHPTEFEIVTAIGFTYFAKQKVDVAVVEVGLGGRLDATNVLDPVMSVITSISLDHMDILGNTLGEIAYEKAGIIKKGKPVITYPQVKEAIEVIRQVAGDRKSSLQEVSLDQITIKESLFEHQIFDFTFEKQYYQDLKLRLAGEHQILNAATALTSLEVLKKLGFYIPEKTIPSGISKVTWPGRLEQVYHHPTIIIDGAHNIAGACALRQAMMTYFRDRKIILVFGVLKDKEVEAILNQVCPIAHTIILTRPDNPRAMDPQELASKISKYGKKVIVEPNLAKAVVQGMTEAGEEGIVLICGSLYLVGAVRKFIKTLN